MNNHATINAMHQAAIIAFGVSIMFDNHMSLGFALALPHIQRVPLHSSTRCRSNS